MVQIAMLVAGVAAGLMAKSWRRVVRITVLVLAITLVVQTVVVAAENELETAKDHLIYWPVQLISFLVALGIARFLMGRRSRQRATA
jgi:cytochrome bd-type quinol oxidase subunit 2